MEEEKKMERHPSLTKPKQPEEQSTSKVVDSTRKEQRTAGFNELAEESIKNLETFTNDLKQMKKKWKELKEIEMSVATIRDFTNQITQLEKRIEQKFDSFAAQMGLNKEVVEKETKILDKLGELLDVT